MSEAKKEAYDPKGMEGRWYKLWEENGYFHAQDTSDKKPFSIVIPPPNVTGSLHMGHALNNTLQDILIRAKRMQGYNALWMPGTDHAGIATQNVVEKALAKEGKTRHDLGREKFIEKVWEWRKDYGGRIMHQLRKLGCSCDWERERFTFDEGLSKAVREVFVRLYEEGLIYRGETLINWCPKDGTALSDIEVEHRDVKSHLWYIRYDLENGEGSLTVATTRPETMLGDTALAVNPNDERFNAFIGKNVILPLVGRPIPVIGDEYVDMEFGTGALKITPAHDFNDFEIGNKHNLERIKVIDEKGQITGGYEFDGMDRFEARKVIVERLEEGGFLEKIEDYKSSVGHSYRSGAIVEPMLSKQWFVKTGPLAEVARKAVSDGKTRIIPETWTKTYYQWMDNIRDWCISRQIWWGHRIPAWTDLDTGEIVVARSVEEAQEKCGSSNLKQEDDVLDTWFSSGLWPFSTLGWPEKTEALETFYPTTVLITGFDILFFWVARMMMMGLKFQDNIPFHDVYLHALVRDENGKKMSKSKGNVVDPLDIIDEYGADAFRFTLASMAAQGRDIALSRDRIAGYRRFANKIFQATRFSLMNMEGFDPDSVDPDTAKFSLSDRWILSRLTHVTEEVEKALEEYRFNDLAHHIYQFIWHELCDWYIELAKPMLYVEDDSEEKQATQFALYTALDGALRLLHPLMPFVSEELWQKLPGTGETLMLADFAIAKDSWRNDQVEKDMAYLTEVITAIRNRRGLLEVPPSKTIDTIIEVSDADQMRILKEMEKHLRTLAKVGELTVGETVEVPARAAGAVVDGTHIYLIVTEVDRLGEKMQQLEKNIAKLEKKYGAISNKLKNENFLAKAREEVVADARAEAEDLKHLIAKATDNRNLLKEILESR